MANWVNNGDGTATDTETGVTVGIDQVQQLQGLSPETLTDLFNTEASNIALEEFATESGLDPSLTGLIGGGNFLQGLALSEFASSQEQQQQLLALAAQNQLFQQDIAGREIALAEQSGAFAATQFQRYLEQFVPLENELIAEVRQGIDPEAEAARSAAEVRSSFDKSRESINRQLGALGLDPSSPRFTGAIQQEALARAAAEAGAKTNARRKVSDINFARRQSLIGLGRGLPSEASNLAASAGALTSAAGQAGAQGSGAFANALGLASNQALGVAGSAFGALNASALQSAALSGQADIAASQGQGGIFGGALGGVGSIIGGLLSNVGIGGGQQGDTGGGGGGGGIGGGGN